MDDSTKSGAAAPDCRQDFMCGLEVVTNAQCKGALEACVGGGWRCAVQTRFGVIAIILADVTIGRVKRGSFAQRVLVADPPEADRIIVPSGFPVVVADISVCVVERDEVFWRNRGGNAKLPLRAVIHSLTGCEGAILCVITHQSEIKSTNLEPSGIVRTPTDHEERWPYA